MVPEKNEKSEPPKAAEETRVFDTKEALSRTDGDIELLSQLMEMYLEQSKGDIVEIEAAISRKDAKRLEFVAHSLKGASATLAAELVREQAYRMEKLGATGNFKEASAILGRLKESINITNGIVNKALSEFRSSTEGSR